MSDICALVCDALSLGVVFSRKFIARVRDGSFVCAMRIANFASATDVGYVRNYAIMLQNRCFSSLFPFLIPPNPLHRGVSKRERSRRRRDITKSTQNQMRCSFSRTCACIKKPYRQFRRQAVQFPADHRNNRSSRLLPVTTRAGSQRNNIICKHRYLAPRSSHRRRRRHELAPTNLFAICGFRAGTVTCIWMNGVFPAVSPMLIVVGIRADGCVAWQLGYVTQ